MPEHGVGLIYLTSLCRPCAFFRCHSSGSWIDENQTLNKSWHTIGTQTKKGVTFQLGVYTQTKKGHPKAMP